MPRLKVLKEVFTERHILKKMTKYSTEREGKKVLTRAPKLGTYAWQSAFTSGALTHALHCNHKPQKLMMASSFNVNGQSSPINYDAVLTSAVSFRTIVLSSPSAVVLHRVGRATRNELSTAAVE
jgi:hypothetical protein